ncbi:hypothetical protein G7068_06520 [Leucobacter viscericola]|uniref:DUF4878 domain-containing protein n=1 Tax=Leucobacter viscericola TaxID=2714935 RepID=A0A6G7XEL5_9MICO|nr:hypothetical protein [Leucobacter viscericola]QIK62889.1 hypothetical protein G7068_06520 [Leucobacter viscericola]
MRTSGSGADSDDEWESPFPYLGFTDLPSETPEDDSEPTDTAPVNTVEELTPIVLPEPILSEPVVAEPVVVEPDVVDMAAVESTFVESDVVESEAVEPASFESGAVESGTVETEYDEPVLPEPVLPEYVAPEVVAPEIGDSADWLEQKIAAADPEPAIQEPLAFDSPETAQPEAAQPNPELLTAIPAPPSWPSATTKARRKRPVGLVVAILAVLLAFGGGYALRAVMTPSSTDGMGMQHSVKSAPKTVEAYLNALASGDASTARKIVGAGTTEPLLGDDVLKKSNELAPISNVSVGAGTADGEQVEVAAKFTVGDTPVERTFRLWNTSGGWQLNDGLIPVSLTSLDGFGVTLNGVAPKQAEARVFPGMYQVGLSEEAFALSSDADAILIATPEQGAALGALQPTPTPDTSARFTQMVRSSLEECVAMTSLVTPCGLDVSAKLNDGATPIEGTVRRSLDDEGKASLDALVVQLDGASPGTTYSVLNTQVKTRLEAENNGSRVAGELLYGGQLLTPYVDFTADSPVVVWK